MVPRGRSRRQPQSGRTANDAPGSFRRALLQAAEAAGRPLGPGEAAAMEVHYLLLRRWGRRMNLTGLRAESDIVARHFIEPIAAADLLGDEGTLLDLGSGNGFPAIPLKILHPGLRLVMVEASERKSAFLWAVAREIGLVGVRVETLRATGRSHLRPFLPCRHLTLRAVKAREMLRGEGPILEPGGRALLFLSPGDAEAIRREPIPGLRLAGIRSNPGNPGSVVAVLEGG